MQTMDCIYVSTGRHARFHGLHTENQVGRRVILVGCVKLKRTLIHDMKVIKYGADLIRYLIMRGYLLFQYPLPPLQFGYPFLHKGLGCIGTDMRFAALFG
ncbi:hypothetical protein Mettu_3469 [Methylobacter tundripaludum SV96]|uniref:Uncharacterized protein n=1 Tax=Methylobacter tundripaludum (strain ATCC BAA-1195 / DSM 17260 / SV96) TaxID=697282 RepID=G3IZG6_METTV|nr:hypothetical protein Mettu_3469 [Methylobacter tundripaludum SV96]